MSTVIVCTSLSIIYNVSLRNTSDALVIFSDKKRGYVFIWNWIERFGSSKIYKRKQISAFIIDKTIIQIE